MSEEVETADYEAVAEAIDQMRELVGALVASLVHDGFTDREARVIVAELFATRLESAGGAS